MFKSIPDEERQLSSLIALFCLYEEPLSGYGVRTKLRKWRVEEFFSISPTTIYRSLARLQDQGCLTGQDVRQGRYPASRVFQITPAGRRQYVSLMKKVCIFRRPQPPLLPLISLGSYLPRPIRHTLASAWIKAADHERGLLEQRFRDHSEGGTYGKPFAEWLILDHEIHRLRSDIQWMRRYLRLLDARKA